MESNVNKMRDALEKLDKLLFVGVDGYVHGQPDKTDEIERTIKSALALSPRNCDVGTEEEQHRRFIEYCNACDCPMGCIHRKQFIGMLDTRCASMLKCYIRWSQMPYESEVKQ